MGLWDVHEEDSGHTEDQTGSPFVWQTFKVQQPLQEKHGAHTLPPAPLSHLQQLNPEIRGEAAMLSCWGPKQRAPVDQDRKDKSLFL